MSPLEDKIWKRLKLVFDPEIPVNIVDLGLIYKVTEYSITIFI
jgi:metal-sulfur cluster biosynthetic enzyme